MNRNERGIDDMSYADRLAARKKLARKDYLNRLYHTWNVLLVRGTYRTNERHMERIRKIEDKIRAETKRRKLAGWPSAFTPPYEEIEDG